MTRNRYLARQAFILGFITFEELEAAYGMIDAGDVAGLSRLLLSATASILRPEG